MCNIFFVQYSKNINSENLKITVANGGTLARKSIKDFMPDIILAIACERDLTSGIFDAYPFFVYGIFNSRPNGDCIDTQVNFSEVEKFLKNFFFLIKTINFKNLLFIPCSSAKCVSLYKFSKISPIFLWLSRVFMLKTNRGASFCRHKYNGKVTKKNPRQLSGFSFEKYVYAIYKKFFK
jgi:hypothetical protein